MHSVFKDFPAPGSIFREYNFLSKGHFSEYDPDSCNPGCDRMREQHAPRKPRHIEIDDLDGALRAEVMVEYWGGHSGTTGQAFRVNRSNWMDIPQPKNTKTEPQCFQRTVLGTSPVNVPLELLRQGVNDFRFAAGPQVRRHSFDWGFYWIYNFTVRVVYDCEKQHPTGRIISPSTGTTAGDTVEVTAEAEENGSKIKQVDFIGYYEDFDYRGMGEYTQWQYQYQYGKLVRHIGTATEAPYTVKWDTSKLPDQEKPIKIIARITDISGISYMTPVTEVVLERKSRSIKMHKSSQVPEKFCIRLGMDRKSCNIVVDSDLSKAKSAWLVISTWSGSEAEEIGLNGRKLIDRTGVSHNYSYDEIPVPLDFIQNGVKEFYVYSRSNDHCVEVNWPGPVLMIEFYL